MYEQQLLIFADCYFSTVSQKRNYDSQMKKMQNELTNFKNQEMNQLRETLTEQLKAEHLNAISELKETMNGTKIIFILNDYYYYHY